MASATDTTTAGDRRAGGAPNGLSSAAGKAVQLLLLAGLVIMLLAGARLALVVGGVPSTRWLDELPVLALRDTPVSDRTVARARFAAEIIEDPSLVTALLGPCMEGRDAARAAASASAFYRSTRDCLDVVDAGLAANPLSGELWVERCILLFQMGVTGKEFARSLRNAYRTAARAGWLAGPRAIIGVRAYSSLPDDLRGKVRDDVDLILEDRRLAGPFVAYFVESEAFREAATRLVEMVSPPKQRLFLDLVKSETGRRTDAHRFHNDR